MMPKSSATRPVVRRAVPAGSRLLRAERAVRGVVRVTARASRAASGTIAPNRARQERNWPTRPPPRFPASPPRPSARVQDANARERCSGAERWTRIDIVAGVISAAPAPDRPRPAISVAGFCASALVAAPAANRASPASSAPLRPCRSPSAPAGMRSPAKTMTYASTIHSSSVCEGCREDELSCGIRRLMAATMLCATRTQAQRVRRVERLRVRSGAGSGIGVWAGEGTAPPGSPVWWWVPCHRRLGGDLLSSATFARGECV